MLLIRQAIASVLALFLYVSAACGQPYPSRVIKLVVPYPAGGAVDIVRPAARRAPAKGVERHHCRGEQGRSRRYGGCQFRRQGRTRRVHDSVERRRHARIRAVAVQGIAVQSARGLRARYPGVGRLPGADGKSRLGHQGSRRLHRNDEGQGCIEQLRQQRLRYLPPFGHGASEANRRNRIDAYPVQGRQ